LLVKRQIERLQAPSLQCVDLVFEELKRVSLQCETLVPELQRFPVLREHVLECVRNLLERRVKPTKTMITNLMHIELAYINTNHPDFIGGSKAVKSLMDRMTEKQKMDELKVIKKPPPQSPPTPPDPDNRSQLPTDREIIETEIIKNLISSYFAIVRKNVQDSVPKAIMYFLVNHSKQDIQSELVKTLYKENLFQSLLKEADDISQKRNACVDLLRIMRRALDIVNNVRDFNCLA